MKSHEQKEFFTFEQSLQDLSSFNWNAKSPEPFSKIDYKEECELKDKAFTKFLQKNGIKCQAKNLCPSPMPRNYRTTTKRRVFSHHNGIGLGFSEPVKAGTVLESALEPKQHQKIYEFLEQTFSLKTYSYLARSLNWLIIRGNYDRQFLILNLFNMNSSIVKKLKHLSDLLQKEKIVQGALTYYDPSKSDYYLEAERAPSGLQIKHLFGPRLLGLKVNDILMRYSPCGFSQINESLVSHMVDLSLDMLSPEADDVLLDLYCGYGLFSHTLGKSCRKVTGYELSIDAINSAREIAKRLKTNQQMKFYAEKINSRLVRDKFSEANQQELILLDPPRKGCEPGVIKGLAQRNPKRVLHIFCGTDVIPKELKQWQLSGYKAKTIQPIDMFAGTANLETMVLLEKVSLPHKE